ncbi:hypothetical protein ACIQ2D_18740 [Lysinibacillus sp. NPDC097287]|uniref:hypothetical protein n=1 Tax=Lysinibacillus sp. NPDC097287 TaxID=3364144 RepID=UPI00382B1CC9
MSLILLLLMGLFGVFLMVLSKRSIIDMLSENNKVVHKLKNAVWFQNHWYAGMFLFVMNATLFLSTGLILYILIYISIPFIHWLVIILATIGSFFVWVIIHKAWQSTNRSRVKMGAIGSSFYVLLSMVFMYWSWTLEPSYPDEDTFMKGLVLMIGVLIATIAGVSCFIFTGLSNKKAV